jgi:hypothetical protein
LQFWPNRDVISQCEFGACITAQIQRRRAEFTGWKFANLTLNPTAIQRRRDYQPGTIET